MAYRPQIKTANGMVDFPLDAETIKGKTLLEQTYPVGAIYLSVNNTSPASLFGGTWASLGNNMKLVNSNGDLPVITGATHNYATASLEIAFKSSNYDRVLGSKDNHIMATTGSATYYDNSEIRPTNLYASLNDFSVSVYMWKRTA